MKSLLTFLLCTTCAGLITAQEYKSKFDVTIGIGEGVSVAHYELLRIPPFVGITIENTYPEMQYYVGFKYSPSDRIWITSTYSQSILNFNWTNQNSNFNESTQYVTQMYSLGLEYEYLRNKYFGMYCGYSVGFLHFHSGNNIENSSANLYEYRSLSSHGTLLGLRFGSKLSLNVELGIGYLGFARTGLSYRW